MDTLVWIHRNLGYFVGAITLLATLWALLLVFRDREDQPISRVVFSGTIGLVDLQVLLGLVMYVSGIRPRLEHPVIMILVAVFYHVGNRQTDWWRFGWFLLGFVFLVLGIVAVL